MCYRPVKRTMDIVSRARTRIQEGKLEEANNLLEAAKTHIELVSPSQVAVRSAYHETKQALAEARRKSKQWTSPLKPLKL